MKKFTVYNLGCKVNAYELSAISSLLIKEGFKEDDNNPDAYTVDVYKKTGKEKKKDNRIFKGSIDAISIPKDTQIPDWLKEFIDYDSIVEDNIKGFPYESIGIQRLDKNHVTYTNIIKF